MKLSEKYQKIQEIICTEKSIQKDLLFRKFRHGKYVEARQIYMYILTYLFKKRISEIAKMTEFNHATVIHSLKKVELYCETERKYKDSFDRIMEKSKLIKDLPESIHVIIPSRRIRLRKIRTLRNSKILAI